MQTHLHRARCDSSKLGALLLGLHYLTLPHRRALGFRAGLCYVLPERRRFDERRGEWVSMSFGAHVGPADLGMGCLGVRPLYEEEVPEPVAHFEHVSA
jgi:hypothetical protein